MIFILTQKNFITLRALKNVGYEAISNIVKEREKNGKFKSLNDFINRVNPKDKQTSNGGTYKSRSI